MLNRLGPNFCGNSHDKRFHGRVKYENVCDKKLAKIYVLQLRCKNGNFKSNI